MGPPRNTSQLFMLPKKLKQQLSVGSMKNRQDGLSIEHKNAASKYHHSNNYNKDGTGSSCSGNNSNNNSKKDNQLHPFVDNITPSLEGKAFNVYCKLAMMQPSEKKSIKVDLIPEVTEDIARQVFVDVMRTCGFPVVHTIDNKVLLTNKLCTHPVLCGPKGDTHYEFAVMQELVIREYGPKGSAKYAALFLTWLDTTPKLVREGTSQLNLLRQGLAQVLGKNFKVSRKGFELLIEEIVGRWRATLFQRGYALEAAALDNGPDALWQNLDPDEVDYIDSDDEEELQVQINEMDDHFSFKSGASFDKNGNSFFRHNSSSSCIFELPPPPPVVSRQRSSVDIDCANVESKRYDEEEEDEDEQVAVALAEAENRTSSNIIKKKGSNANLTKKKSERRRAKSCTLPRPKSALKFPLDNYATPHDRKKPRSVQFCSDEQVLHLEISRIHREARMGVGCKAINQYGQVRPLTSTRTGCLIYLEQPHRPPSPPPYPPPPRRRHQQRPCQHKLVEETKQEFLSQRVHRPASPSTNNNSSASKPRLRRQNTVPEICEFELQFFEKNERIANHTNNNGNNKPSSFSASALPA